MSFCWKFSSLAPRTNYHFLNPHCHPFYTTCNPSFSVIHSLTHSFALCLQSLFKRHLIPRIYEKLTGFRNRPQNQSHLLLNSPYSLFPLKQFPFNSPGVKITQPHCAIWRTKRKFYFNPPTTNKKLNRIFLLVSKTFDKWRFIFQMFQWTLFNCVYSQVLLVFFLFPFSPFYFGKNKVTYF